MTEGIIKGEWCADRMSIEYGDDIVININSADAVIPKEKQDYNIRLYRRHLIP